uniref:Uncharacterized protein n=1 Tax=Zea mays TaxID=4577 RepID=B4FQ09_MAIZE|nr:unknown [Zea mays]
MLFRLILRSGIFLIEKEIIFWDVPTLLKHSMDFRLFIYNSERRERKKTVAFPKIGSNCAWY